MKNIFFLIALFSINTLYAQTIWSGAGLLPNTFDKTDVRFNVDSYTGSDDEKLADALDDAKNYVATTQGCAMIYFAGRTYNLTQSIKLHPPDSNIVFRGSGAAGGSATVLSFSFPGASSADSTCFLLVGDESSIPVTTLSQSVNYLYKNIQAYDLSSLDVGDWFRLSDINHSGLEDGRATCVSQITRLAGKNGNAGEMEDVAGKTWQWQDASNLAIYKLDPVRNVGIENLKIVRNNTGHAQTGGGEYGTTILFRHAANCWLKGVHFEQTCRHHVMAYKSARIYIHGCYFHDARHFGQKGYGYGVLLTFGTSRCLIENNIFDKLRHAMIVQEGANRNVFTFNYSYKQYWMLYEDELEEEGWGWIADFIDVFPYRTPICGYMGVPEYCGGDICLHGNYPFSNLFEQNWSCIIVADGFHGANGVYNTFFRNITFDDERIDAHAMQLHDSPDYEVGCSMEYPDRAVQIGASGDTGSNWVDYFGYYNGSLYGHLAFNPGSLTESAAYYGTKSLYYISEPDFKSGYSWPALGPRLYENQSFSSISQNIPARDRFNTSTKTYSYQLTGFTTSSGTLLFDETWTGPITCTGDVTVPVGITLTIDPGATVTFPDNKKLLVYGTLNAVGTSSSPIDFDCSDAGETWYGVTFESGSSGELQYCTIRNASYGAYVKQCATSITNCTFIDNNTAFRVYMGMNLNTPFADNTLSGGTYGMYLYDPDPSCSIENCTIDDPVFYGIRTSTVDDWTEFIGNNVRHCGREGVRLYRSSPVLFDNNIYSNDEEGIYMYYDSDPCLFDGILGGNNVVAYNALWGIYMNSTSHPTLGSASGQWDEGNSYYSNGSGELYSLNSQVIDARNSWWGQAYTDTTLLRINGNFYCSPILGWMDPNPDPLGLSKSSIAEGSTESSGTLQTTALSDSIVWRLFAKAHALQMQKKYDEAIPLYQQIIDEHVQTPEAEMAVVRLARCYKRTEQKSQGKQEIIALSDSKESDAVAVAAELEAAEWELQDGNIDEAIAHYEGVVRAKKSCSQQALVDLWAVHFHITGNRGQQTALLKQYETWYGEDENVIDMKLAMRLISGKEARKWAQEHADDEELGKGATPSAESALPKQFALHANYPNPFNPTTRIAYDLPEASVVRLEIFNVLGRRAALLLDERRDAGRHIAVWDGRTASGTKAAAGLYFCRMTAGEFAKTIKMTLLP